MCNSSCKYIFYSSTKWYYENYGLWSIYNECSNRCKSNFKLKYDSLGSSWGWNDNPNGHYSVYYDDLTTLVDSATATGSQIKVTSGVEQLTSDQLNVTGNCTIYRHVKDGKDEYWAYYETGNYAITLKADSMNHLVKMLNSIQMK